jgi:hypothetical protein
MPDRVPEDMPAEDMPGRMPEDMPDRMPEDMPDKKTKMPEGMSDRMPRFASNKTYKCHGGDNSKFFFLSLFFSGGRPLPQMRCRGVGGLRLAAMDGGWFGIFWNNILCSDVKDRVFGSS